ncbi:MAG: cold shock domain-containing protein [Candidatus Hermodarchaeota archaeon]
MAKKKQNSSKIVSGHVKWFDAKKGYGFISVEDRNDIFVHFSNIDMQGFRKLDMGDEVEFEMKESKDRKGPEALKVKVISKDRRY